MLSLLRQRNFALAWLAALFSETGDWLLIAGLPIYVFQLTGSSLVTSTVFIVELAPTLLFGSFAGVVVDRWDRRRTLLVLSIAQAAVLVPLATVHTGHSLWLVYVVAAAEALLAVLVEPAKNALLPALVSEHELVSANGLVALNANLGRLIGSPLGGLLAATGALTGIALGDAASFLIAALLIAALRLAPLSGSADAVTRGGLRRAWLEGLRTVTGNTQVRVVLVVAAITAIAQGIFVVLFVVFVGRALHGGGAEIGLLRGVQAIGGIAGGLLVGAIGRRVAPASLLAASTVAFGILSLAAWNTPALTTATGVYIGLFITIGIPGIGHMTGMITIVQQHVPPDMLGRAFASLLTIFNGCQALGMILAGTLGDMLGVITVLNGQAGLYLLAGVITLGAVRAHSRRARACSAPAPSSPQPDPGH